MRTCRTSGDTMPASVVAVGTVAAVGLLLVLVGLAAEVGNVSNGLVTRDPATLGELPWYAGALSHVTVMLWAGGAVAAGIAAGLARGRERRACVAFAGWLAVLGLDDALLLHDQALPSAGVPEVAVLGVHALISLVVVTQLLVVGSVPRLLVLGGAGALITSAAVDVLAVDNFLVEDGAKLLGTTLWAAATVWHVLDLHRRAVLLAGRPPDDVDGLRYDGPEFGGPASSLLGAATSDMSTVPSRSSSVSSAVRGSAFVPGSPPVLPTPD